MAFRIENPEVETKIRELSKLRGQSISATINYVVKKELEIELQKIVAANENDDHIA
jgi:hypothetical protein